MTQAPAIKTTPLTQVNESLSRLTQQKDAWVGVGIQTRIRYLQQCIAGVRAVAADWAELACCAKGLDPNSTLAGEEWITGPVATLRNLQQLVRTLQANGQPQPISWQSRPDGQQVAQVFPDNLMEKLLWLGITAEVWIQPGRPSTQGAIYRDKGHRGRVALVLGAGNISAIAPTDTLYKLFAEDQVVLLKMNPVNVYLGPILEQAFASLRAAGFFDVVYGGAEVGEYLCQHSQIGSIHITGSQHTHDAIVWGSTLEEQTRRQAANDPKLTKTITSELGCVTPILVVPGDWSASDLTFQARQIASMVAHNASFNCVAGKVVVIARGWPQREAFLRQLCQELAQMPARPAYYPGAQQRYQAFLDRYPQAQACCERTAEIVPWTVIPDVPPEPGEYALTQEAFCGVLAEVTLEVTDARAFLAAAVGLVNEQVWGSLSCNILIDPKTQRECTQEFEAAIAALRYGQIAINLWSGASFLLSTTPWGAYPGQTLNDIGSGQGVVHNTYLFDYPQKAVVRAPFRIFPTPAWFPTHKNLRQLGQRLTWFEAQPSWSKFLSVVLAAIKG